MDPQLLLLHRQYLQLFNRDFLAWPPKQLLRDADVQSWIYSRCFDESENARLPPARYQVQVLKKLISKIEASIEDPEEDEISDALVSHLSTLMAAELPSETTAVQQKKYVTFTCPLPGSDINEQDSHFGNTVTLLERPNLIFGSLTTGFRTWEASMHLGAYLLSPDGAALIRGKNILELGIGTGFTSILCAKLLGAKHVTSTDGDESVVEAFKENLFLNGLDEDPKVLTSILRWGRGLRGTWVEEDCEANPYDVIVGADITYDKTAVSSLVATLRMLFELRPTLQAIIAGAIRNPETFETFRQACLRAKFEITEIDFPAQSIREQKALFYTTAVPLKILSIKAPASSRVSLDLEFSQCGGVQHGRSNHRGP